MTFPIAAGQVAVDALRDTIRAALPLPDQPDGVQVYDGPAPERAYSPRAVTVAAAFQDDQNAVDEERVESGARPTVTTTLTVAGSVYAGGGDVDVDGYRRQAGGILAAIGAALEADRTLGGTVSLARLASAQWIQGRDAKGTGVAVGYTVQLVSMS